MIIDYSSDRKQYKVNILDFKGIWQWECPTCGAKYSFHRHGTYDRNVVFFKDNCLIEEKRTILRLKCSSCGHTHAVLPLDVIPFHIYSATVMITLCSFVYEKRQSVLTVADETAISYQLLYLFLHIVQTFFNRIRHLLRQLQLWKYSHNPSITEVCEILHHVQPLSDFFIHYLRHFRTPLFFTRHSTVSYSFWVGF